MQVTTKASYRSRTLWIGLAVALLPVAEGTLGVFAALGVEWPAVVSFIGGLIAVLRWVTTQPVSLAGGDSRDV